MKITTWNVNGIRARSEQVSQWLFQEQPDVLCLQEIKATQEFVPPDLLNHPDYWSYWHGYKGYSGVALQLKKATFPKRPGFGHPSFDHEARIVTSHLGHWVLASIYVPNGGKDFPAKLRFLESLDGFVREAHQAGKQLILCGDLNVARENRDVHPKLRNPAQIGQTPAERTLLDRLLSQGLTDLGRHFEPDNDQLFTWWAPWRNQRERNIGWRLDYVLASPELAAAATGARALRDFGTSDHGPVTVEFSLPPPAYEEPPPPVLETGAAAANTSGQLALAL